MCGTFCRFATFSLSHGSALIGCGCSGRPSTAPAPPPRSDHSGLDLLLLWHAETLSSSDVAQPRSFTPRNMHERRTGLRTFLPTRDSSGDPTGIRQARQPGIRQVLSQRAHCVGREGGVIQGCKGCAAPQEHAPQPLHLAAQPCQHLRRKRAHSLRRTRGGEQL